jgi:hypothetical protein
MNLAEQFKNSRLFPKPTPQKYFILRVMHWLCKPCIMWEWDDFGIMFRIFRNTGMGEYYISIDIQILWCNLWLQCFKKAGA